MSRGEFPAWILPRPDSFPLYHSPLRVTIPSGIETETVLSRFTTESRPARLSSVGIFVGNTSTLAVRLRLRGLGLEEFGSVYWPTNRDVPVFAIVPPFTEIAVVLSSLISAAYKPRILGWYFDPSAR